MSARRLVRNRRLTRWFHHPSWWIDAIIAAALGAAASSWSGRYSADAHDETGDFPDMPQPVLNARALKCTIVLDPAEIAQITAPDGRPRVVIDIRLPDRRVSVDLNAKSVRRAIATISEHGPEGVAVIVQGKLVGDTITEAGMFSQPKVRPQPAAAEAA
jgi:hypothetical protein